MWRTIPDLIRRPSPVAVLNCYTVDVVLLSTTVVSTRVDMCITASLMPFLVLSIVI